MQTFLPYADFDKTAQVLDRQRLGKQRIEAKQILQNLLEETEKQGWKNHPAVKMWKGSEGVLAQYGVAICAEWVRRGYKDNQMAYFVERVNNAPTPTWLGDNAFHVAHQSNLVRKNAEHYGKYFQVTNDLPYVWPV